MVSPDLIQAILAQYTLPWWGTHGISHWARVLEIGRRLAEPNGARRDVVELFAVFHDARRRNEHIDPWHGRRGGKLAAEWRGRYFDLDGEGLDLLVEACAGHTNGHTQADVTVQTCWDSDRLDLLRAGYHPNPHRLCTDAARDPEIIAWANARSEPHLVPGLIQTEWGVEIPFA